MADLTYQSIPRIPLSSSRRSDIAAAVGYGGIVAVICLYVFLPSLNLLMAAGLLSAIMLIAGSPRQARDFRAWLAALGVQFNQSIAAIAWRPALSDLILLPLSVGIALDWWRSKRALPRVALIPWIGALAFVVCISGTAMTQIVLGHVPMRTILAKDAGLLVLVIGYLAVLWLATSQSDVLAIVRTVLRYGLLLQGLALLGFVALSSFGIHTQFVWETGNLRLAGLLVNPTAEGGFLLTLLLIQLSLTGTGKPIQPAGVAWLSAIVFFVGLVLTFSRSAWIAAAAGLLVLAAARWGLSRRQRVTGRLISWPVVAAPLAMVVVLGLLLLPVLGSSFSPQVLQRLTTKPIDSLRAAANPPLVPSVPEPHVPFPIASGPGQAGMDLGAQMGNSEGIETRIAINALALEMFTASPLTMALGTGVGSFLAKSSAFGLREGIVIHSTYLWILVETGLLGLAALSGLLGRAVFIAFRAAADSTGIEQAIATGVLSSIVATMVLMLANEVLYQRHLWVLFGLAEVLYRLSRSEPPSARANA